MKLHVTSHSDVVTIDEADRISAENGCTDRSKLIGPGDVHLGYCYWVRSKERPGRGVEKAVFYSHLQVLDVWKNGKKPEVLPEDCESIIEKEERGE